VGLILEMKKGPLAGQRVPLASGQSLLIGRAPDRAQFAVPQDNHMSGVHFAVECGPNGCRVVDKKSTNGTFLNGARIQEAMIAGGDEITAGQTVFVVRMVPDDQLPAASPSAQPPPAAPPFPPPAPSAAPPYAPPQGAPAPPPAPAAPHVADVPRPYAPAPPDRTYKEAQGSAPFARPEAARSEPQAPVAPPPAAPRPQPAVVPSPGRPSAPPALTIGKWTFSKIPEGWQIQEGLGIQMLTKDDKVFPSNIGAMEEPVGPGITLSQYVEAQTKMFREYLREPRIDAALPPKLPGATETIALEVRYNTKDGQSIYYHRLYVRSGSTIGVLTLTTLEKDLASVRPDYDAFLAGASFIS